MRTHSTAIKLIADDLLRQAAEEGGKPNYSDADFFACIYIFHTAILDKMFDLQSSEGMSMDDKCKMAETCGEELRKFVKVYTGLDTYELAKLP